MATIDELERRIATLENRLAGIPPQRTVQIANSARGRIIDVRQVYVISVGVNTLTVRAIRRTDTMSAWEWVGGTFEAEPMAMMPISNFDHFVVTDITSPANTSFWAIKESGVWRVAFLPKFAMDLPPAAFVDECL